MSAPESAKRGEFFIMLRIVIDDAKDDDPRDWPYDDLLAAPEGESCRFVEYVHGVKETSE
jgi:hypothetical protein